MRHHKIHQYDLASATMGCNMAAIADMTNDTTYRDIVWKVRDVLQDVVNERRLAVYEQRKLPGRYPPPPPS